MKKRIFNRKRNRRGFTLIECIVSIAIFTIMATMFASFMMSSVRVVNLTLANEADREALLEAISSADSAECHTANGVVKVAAVGTDGQLLYLDLTPIYEDNGKVKLEDKYVKYTGPNGTIYNIYLGANAMEVRYLALLNQDGNNQLLDAVRTKKKVEDLQVTYRGDTEQFVFTVDASEEGATTEIVNNSENKPVYVKYTKKNGEKYLIYLWKDSTAGKTEGGNTTP